MNCNYPLNIIENTVNKIFNNNFSSRNNNDNHNHIQLYIQLDNVRCFSNDKKELNSIITNHVKCNDNNKLSVIPFFKPFKLSSCFTTRTKCPFKDRTRVVYSFECTEDRCNANYIGYTTNSVLTRCKQHRYASSSIYSHHQLRPY